MRGAIRIIGIDPGLRCTGWGVIETDGVKLGFIACGSVSSDSDESLGVRLRQIFDGLMGVLAELEPAEAAIEQTFVNRDAVQIDGVRVDDSRVAPAWRATFFAATR
jgi:crossover junction endodeoxyribonuclease RuvC